MARLSNLLDVLKIEVEQPTTGLRNLLANPSGDLGAWAWLTPSGVLRRGSDVNGSYLEFQTAGGATTGPQSEDVPVSPGQYVAASWFTISADAMWVSAFFTFYGADGVGFTTLPAALVYSNAVGARANVSPVLVPAGSVTARLQILFSSTAVPPNTTPVAGKKFRYREAVVATAATAAALGPTYSNLCPNPSFETNTTGWAVIGPFSAGKSGTGTFTRVVGGMVGSTLRGAACGRLVRTSGTATCVQSPQIDVGPSTTYRITFDQARTGVGATPNTAVQIREYNSLGVAVGTPIQIPRSVSSAPAWAYSMTTGPSTRRLRIQIETTDASLDIDGLMVTDGPWVTPYFDGATPDTAGVDYAWTGTAHLSTSTKSMSNLPYIAPVDYLEIQGAAVQIGLQRRTFDSTLSVTIRDAALDPVTNGLLRPGRAVKVSTKPDDGIWRVLFQGTQQKPAVDYGDLKRKRRPVVTLTAYGPGVDLAGTKSPDGVATIPELPQVLEGVRVPFKVNGSTDQVVPTASVSRNDSAFALDQVILTRDSQQGYAWVTKEGVLMAYSNRTLDYYGTGLSTFTEAEYTNLAVSWPVDQVINMVTVILLKFNAATGETEEVTYGPYIDYASRKDWGPNPAEFRVQGPVVPATFAAAVLAANATPELRVDRIRTRIKDTADLVAQKALIDLYAKARVTNTDKGLDATMRVQGIDHAITWPASGEPRWYMDLLFAGEDQVATPIQTPPAGGAGNSILEGVWQAPVLAGAWVNFGSTWETAGYLREDGYVELRGLIKSGSVASGFVLFTLPPGYRPGTDKHIVTESNGAAAVINVLANGQVKINTVASNASLSLANIRFKAEN